MCCVLYVLKHLHYKMWRLVYVMMFLHYNVFFRSVTSYYHTSNCYVLYSYVLGPQRKVTLTLIDVSVV
jgi:hypothetical protein